MARCPTDRNHHFPGAHLGCLGRRLDLPPVGVDRYWRESRNNVQKHISLTSQLAVGHIFADSLVPVWCQFSCSLVQQVAEGARLDLLILQSLATPRSMVRIASFSEIDTIVSDTGLRAEVQEKVRGFGCNLILA